MKFLNRLLLLCIFWCGTAFTQTTRPVIDSSNCEKPSYPSASSRLSEEGTVQLRFLVGKDGKVVESAVEKSTGFRRLDEAAIQGLSKCTFKPGLKDGFAVESWASIKYTWRQELPSPCLGSDVSKWRSCLGTLTTPMGGLSVVVYEAGKKNGRGIEYDASGKVIRAGIFEGENLVSERNLDPKLYPFFAQLPANSANQSLNTPAVQPYISSSNSISQQKEFKSYSTILKNSDSWAVLVDEQIELIFNPLTEIISFNLKKIQFELNPTKDKHSGKICKLEIGISSWSNDGKWKDDLPYKRITLDQKIEVEPRKKYEVPVPPLSINFPIKLLNQTDVKYRLTLKIFSERPQIIGSSCDAHVPSHTPYLNNYFIEQRSLLSQVSPQPPLSQVGKQSDQTGGDISKRVALVVGNGNYKIRPLKNSTNDAEDISQSLKANGFDVIDLRDATLPQMRKAVREFGDRLINNDVGLVYYSGHGVEVKGRNYFIPVNADIQREDEIADQGLDVSLILEKMSTAGKGVNILIVDACRDDPFGRSFRSSTRGLANMDAPRGTIIAYATSPGKVASDGDPRERNSPYTKHLVKAMQSPNKPVEQVFKEVRRAVQDETKNQQTPWENTSLSGDFFFRVQR